MSKHKSMINELNNRITLAKSHFAKVKLIEKESEESIKKARSRNNE